MAPTTAETGLNRRSFLKVSALAGGGMVIGMSWLGGCESGVAAAPALPKEWFRLNGFLKISDTGLVTIMSPNPEGGQNVKTGMPMIVAEELDADSRIINVRYACIRLNYSPHKMTDNTFIHFRKWPFLRFYAEA